MSEIVSDAVARSGTLTAGTCTVTSELEPAPNAIARGLDLTQADLSGAVDWKLEGPRGCNGVETIAY